MRLSNRLSAVTESRTVQFTSLLARYAAKGVSIINMAVGEPDHATPLSVIDATKQALDNGKTRYGAIQGIKALRAKLSEQFDGCSEENIIISNGSKQALYAVFQTICNPLDEVIVPRPYWVSFSEQVKLASAVPVFVDTLAHQLDCRAVSDAVTERTRAIVINSPNNPTGAVYPFESLRKIADIAVSRDLFIISDEAYGAFLYEKERPEGFSQMKDIRDRLVVVRSFSKTYGMTGFRVGYVVAPGKIITALARLQSHLTGNVCTFAQEGALAALSVDPLWLEETCARLEKKRDLAYEHVRRRFDCIKPAGGFYLFPNVSPYLKKGQTSEDFCAHLLEKGGVAVVPGEAFGMGGHIRISYAVPEQELITGFQRIASVL
jgi:aspartate aminotransferase